MAAESDTESKKKLDEKEEELRAIFLEIKLPHKDTYKLAVLGCGDKRHLKGNTKISESVLGKKIENTTYDLDVKHLGEDAEEHDCTEELPGKDFDITYAHVLLKFIPRELQVALIENSYNALASGGVAIHVIDGDNIKPDKDGFTSVDLDYIKDLLTESNIDYKIVELKYGFALVIIKA